MDDGKSMHGGLDLAFVFQARQYAVDGNNFDAS